VLVAPDFPGVILAFLVDGLRAPIVLFPRHVRSALDEQDALAAGGEAIRERPPARAGADDDDVEMIRHTGIGRERAENLTTFVGRDGELRRPRRVQRRNARCPYHLAVRRISVLFSVMEIPQSFATRNPVAGAPQKEIYFITINCADRSRTQLALRDV